MSLSFVVAALAASVAPFGPANGQCRLCDKPTTLPVGKDTARDIRLDIDTALDFDRLILVGGGAGSAEVRANGFTAAEGALAQVSPRAMVGSATIHGEPGRLVRIELPSRIMLHSLGGGVISVENVASDLPSAPRLDSAGSLTFRFGGRVRIRGDVDGQFRGDLPITVEYL